MAKDSGFRWTVERLIALLGAGGGIVALLVFLGLGPLGGSKKEASPTPSAPDCFIAGTVFDAKNQALPSTAVGFEGSDGSFSFLAATLADGRYQATCAQIAESKLRLRLSRVEWGGCVIAPESPKEVARGRFEALNIRAPASTQCSKTISTSQLGQILSRPSAVTVAITPIPPKTLNPGLTR
jgi:hypothetical protein